MRIANPDDQQIENVTWPWEGSQTLPKKQSLPSLPTLDPASYILAHAYAHRKSRGSTGRKCNMAMGGPPNPAKTQCFPTLDPASYILAHAYAHRKSRGSTGRKCNMAMGRLPNPAKTQCFPTYRPCILHFSTRVCASQIAGINRSKM